MNLEPKFEQQLRERLLSEVEFVLKYLAADIRDAEKEIAEVYNKEELTERFAPQTFGEHEALDRAFVQQEMWEHYVMGHPSVISNKFAFIMSKIALEFMRKTYEEVSRPPL